MQTETTGKLWKQEAGAVGFSSVSSEWDTPQDFFDKLNAQFDFTLDPCATEANAKCDKYFTPEDDGLSQSWKGHTVFVNPPVRPWYWSVAKERL